MGRDRKDEGRKGSSSRPVFSDDQIVHASDIQRRWKQTLESKLPVVDFLVMYSGSKPKAAILDYEKFVALWQMAMSVADEMVEIEATRRVIEASGRTLTSLDELIRKAGISREELKETPDVEFTQE